jgi:crossover junction endodeoxyribonuclease RuvC
MAGNEFVIGIDPGQTGAIAILGNGHGFAKVYSMPTYPRPKGGTMVDGAALSHIIESATLAGRTKAVIEKVSAMPGQGVTSMFRFGQAEGIARGVIAAHGIPICEALPVEWKRHFGLIGKPKDAARVLAIERFKFRDTLAGKLARKKDGGRADALLIALWALETGRV